MNISDLLPRLQSRDPAAATAAFAELVGHFQRPLFGYLGRLGLPSGQAEEVAQETFLRVWQNLASYRPGLAAFSTWLYTIAHRLALNELTRAAAQRESPVTADTPESVCEQPQPPEQLAARQQRQRLLHALHQLPLAERSILALAYVQELPLDDVARIEGCTPGAAKVRLHRARHKLAALLEPHHES